MEEKFRFWKEQSDIELISGFVPRFKSNAENDRNQSLLKIED